MNKNDIVKFGPGEKELTLYFSDEAQEDYAVTLEVTEETVTENGVEKPTGFIEKITLTAVKK